MATLCAQVTRELSHAFRRLNCHAEAKPHHGRCLLRDVDALPMLRHLGGALGGFLLHSSRSLQILVGYNGNEQKQVVLLLADFPDEESLSPGRRTMVVESLDHSQYADPDRQEGTDPGSSC